MDRHITLTLAAAIFAVAVILCAFGLTRWGLTAIAAGLLVQAL